MIYRDNLQIRSVASDVIIGLCKLNHVNNLRNYSRVFIKIQREAPEALNLSHSVLVHSPHAPLGIELHTTLSEKRSNQT